jgi:protein SCO1
MNRTIVGVVLGLLAVACTPNRSTIEVIPDYGRVPEFSLTESSGRTVSLKDLHGKVWVADFIFTSCAGTCPMMSGQMRKMQDALPREIQMVSFTVDPARDTPAVLDGYAKKYGADPQRWMFLTGDRQSLYDLSIKGFKLALDDTQGTEAEPITHSSRFVLVDRNGQIRGYYSGTEEADLKRLADDVRKLL